MGGFSRPSRLCATVVFFVVALLGSASASSQNRYGPSLPNEPELGAIGERINSDTIAIVSGDVNAICLSIACDLSAALDNGDESRVLPVVGKGGGQNIENGRSGLVARCCAGGPRTAFRDLTQRNSARERR